VKSLTLGPPRVPSLAPMPAPTRDPRRRPSADPLPPPPGDTISGRPVLSSENVSAKYTGACDGLADSRTSIT
jgi:hypothetical protein